MRHLFSLIAALILAIILITLAALLIGRAQPIPARVALLHLTDCHLPCWIGIVPGRTKFDDALGKIKIAYPHSELRTTAQGWSLIQSDNHLMEIRFSPQHDSDAPVVRNITLNFEEAHGAITYGDLMLLLGSPDQVFLPMYTNANSAVVYANYPVEAGFGVVGKQAACPGLLLSRTITEIALGADLTPHLAIAPWRGFRTCYPR